MWVAEIKSMEFHEISNNERKDIREELKFMKAEPGNNGNRVYFSVGSILVILLILILIISTDLISKKPHISFVFCVNPFLQ